MWLQDLMQATRPLRLNLDVSTRDRRQGAHGDREICDVTQRAAYEREIVAALGRGVVGNRRDPVDRSGQAFAVVLDPKNRDATGKE